MGVIDEYLASFEGELRTRLDQMRQAIHEAAPDAEEVLSYAMPTFDLRGHHLVHFAGFQNHIGLYPTPHGITAFEEELSTYKKAKGSVQFPHDRPLPLDLVRRITQVRREEVLSKPAKKPRKT